MDEISNKTLVILLIGAIIISLGGTLISLNRLASVKIPIITGFLPGAPETAIVQLNIEGVVQVNFTIDTIDWGSGTIISSYCILNSYDAAIGTNCSDFGPNTAGLVLENIGTFNVTLNITMEKDATSFIAGTNPVCQWNVSESEPGSAPGLALTPGDWQPCSTTPVVVCNETGNGFLYGNSNDELHFDVEVKIATDATPGSKTNVMTATAIQV